MKIRNITGGTGGMRIRICSAFLQLLCATFILNTTVAAPPALARTDSYDLDIPSQNLNDALQALALALHHKLLYSSELVDGKSSPALKGKFTAVEAVKKLLSGTNLRYQVTSDGLLLIRAAGAPMSSNATSLPPTSDAGGQASQVTTVPLAQADVPDSQNAPQTEKKSAAKNQKDSSDASKKESGVGLEEVVVTGSHIRGVSNDSSPMLLFDRDYIEHSGFSNMSEFVDSLPQNFSGGAGGSSETATFGNSYYEGQNLSRGTGFNLRGLGSVATLTLIDGRRVAPSAEGEFVDVSSIPLQAVERVEILTDGASAVYGADAVAGVVNIILRKNYDGAETSVNYGTATRGGTSEDQLSQTVGKSWAGGSALLIADFDKREPLDARDRDYIVAAGGAPLDGPTWLLPKRKSESLIFNFNQDLPDRLDVFANVLYSHADVGQAQTDTTEDLLTDHPVTDDYSALLGLGYSAFGDWRFEFDGTVAQALTVTDVTYTYIPTGALEFLINDYRDKYDTWSADFKADGSLFSLPSGKVRLATGMSYRKDDLISTRDQVIPDLGPATHANYSRNVDSVFAELFVPIVSREQGYSWARRIDLSLAARYDDYSDFGKTTNPKVGLVWTPVDSLDLRASYGTSFRAPTVLEEAQVTRGIQISNVDLDALNGSLVPAFYLAGSEPLTAERAKDTSIGFTFKPQSVKGAALTFNYFNIDYTNRISIPPFDATALFNRGEFGSLLTDIPNDAAAQAYLAAQVAAGALFIDQLGTGAKGVRYVFNLLQQNAARTQTNGFDFTPSYVVTRGADTYNFNLNLTHINKILNSLLSNTTPIEQVNTYEQPLKTRVRALGTWTRGGWNTSVAANYSNAYVNGYILAYQRIKAWTTIDTDLTYEFGNSTGSAFFNGSKASLGISNLFDVNPPHATDPLYNMGFDVFNANALGRYVTVRFTKRW